MKKTLALILTAALVLSLAACGGSGGTEDSNTSDTGNGDTTSTDTPSGGGEDSTPENEVFHLGDTVTTDDIEITLIRVESGDILYNNVATDNVRDEYYLRPTSLLTDEELEAKKWQDEYIQKHYGVSPITYEADDGRILVAFAFEVKSISKTALPIDTILERVDIDYNNGYIFEQSELCAGIGGSWENTYYATDAKIEPLDSTVYEFRGYADVPEEVMNNTDSSLNLNVYLNGRSHGRTTPDIVFNVR